MPIFLNLCLYKFFVPCLNKVEEGDIKLPFIRLSIHSSSSKSTSHLLPNQNHLRDGGHRKLCVHIFLCQGGLVCPAIPATSDTTAISLHIMWINQPTMSGFIAPSPQKHQLTFLYSVMTWQTSFPVITMTILKHDK